MYIELRHYVEIKSKLSINLNIQHMYVEQHLSRFLIKISTY